MKIILNLIFILMLFSCNSNQLDFKAIESNENHAFTPVNSDLNQLDSIISINGFWIDEKYYRELIKTKSPKDLEIPNTSCFQIPQKTKQKTRLIYGFYESGGELIVMRNGKNYEFWDVESNKRINQIEVINEEIIKLDNQSFIKLNSLNLLNEISDIKILENLLFLGKYRNTNGQFVEFKSTGELLGFDNYNEYQVPIEIYSEGVESNTFLVSNNGNNETEFGFKFKDDSLFVYNLKCVELNGKNNICYKHEVLGVNTILVKVH